MNVTKLMSDAPPSLGERVDNDALASGTMKPKTKQKAILTRFSQTKVKTETPKENPALAAIIRKTTTEERAPTQSEIVNILNTNMHDIVAMIGTLEFILTTSSVKHNPRLVQNLGLALEILNEINEATKLTQAIKP